MKRTSQHITVICAQTFPSYCSAIAVRCNVCPPSPNRLHYHPLSLHCVVVVVTVACVCESTLSLYSPARHFYLLRSYFHPFHLISFIIIFLFSTTSSITFRQSSNPGPVLAPPSPAPVQEGDVLFLEEAGFEVVVGLGEEDTDHHNLSTQDTQHAPRTHSTPHSPDTQNTQDAPRAHNTQEPQNAQEGQDTQNTQGPSRTQNTQGPPRAPGTQGPPRAPGTQGPSRAPGTQQAPHAQDAPRARYTNMHDTQIPSASTTVPDTPSAPRPRSRTTKRKTADATDEAIMEELARGRKRDSDRDYTFCMNLYAELQHRSEPVKRIIKREIQQTLDVHDE